MHNLFEQNLIDRINLAKAEKEGKNKERINLKLKELQENITVIDQRKQSIVDEKSYLKYVDFLRSLIENTVEQIMAPTVDDFINWVNEITDEKNNTNSKRLRDFLVKNYSQSNISVGIETILMNKDALSIEKSIFFTLITEIKKVLKKECNEFLNKPDEFQNTIAAYLDLLRRRLIDINQAKELKFIEQKEFYTADQITSNIGWYHEIIETIIETNQSLKPLNKIEEDLGEAPVTKMCTRINDIKSCIQILDDSKVANVTDEVYKNIFHKIVAESIKYDGGVKNNLEEFIEKKWNEIETKYISIKKLFENKHSISYNSNWDIYSDKDELQSIIFQYNSLIKDNILETDLTSKSTLSIQQSLSSKSKAINDFESYAATVRNNILQVFKNTLSEYESKNIALLDSLAISKPSIKSICSEIKESLEGLKNGLNSLEKSTDIIFYLSEDFLSDLNTSNDITALFRKALNESGMSEHLNWLESKLNGSDNGSVTSQDFGNPTLIKELLDKGLIKIEIQKTF